WRSISAAAPRRTRQPWLSIAMWTRGLAGATCAGHGVGNPHQIKHWCLGNEMDGPWQIGHMTAEEYGRKAADAARQMRVIDRSIQLIACGSSGPFMPTYLDWDRRTL